MTIKTKHMTDNVTDEGRLADLFGTNPSHWLGNHRLTATELALIRDTLQTAHERKMTKQQEWHDDRNKNVRAEQNQASLPNLPPWTEYLA